MKKTAGKRRRGDREKEKSAFSRGTGGGSYSLGFGCLGPTGVDPVTRVSARDLIQ
jgi:hypothetical protein